jgi:hypothetical protein
VTNENAWTNILHDTINTVSLTDGRLARYTYLPPTANASSWYSGAAGLVFGFSNTGAKADAGGFKHKRGTAGCATAAAAGALCTTTVTWTTAFADANYTVSCTGDAVTSGVPVNGGVANKHGASMYRKTKNPFQKKKAGGMGFTPPSAIRLGWNGG